MLTVEISPAINNNGARDVTAFAEGGSASPVNFGADGAGWVATGKLSVVELYLTCDYRQASTFPLFAEPYLEVNVSGAVGISSAPQAQIRQAFADIALKLAKAVAHRVPCANQVRLVDQAPKV